MIDKLINFETAKLAKDKGLCEYFANINPTNYVPAFYSEDNISYKEAEFKQEDCTIDDRYYRPTQSLLQKWLREVHNINISILIRPIVKDFVSYIPFLNLYTGQDSRVHCDNLNISSTYEEALEIGLQEALKLIK